METTFRICKIFKNTIKAFCNQGTACEASIFWSKRKHMLNSWLVLNLKLPLFWLGQLWEDQPNHECFNLKVNIILEIHFSKDFILFLFFLLVLEVFLFLISINQSINQFFMVNITEYITHNIFLSKPIHVWFYFGRRLCRKSTSMRCITFHSEIVIFKPDINQKQAKAMPLN